MKLRFLAAAAALVAAGAPLAVSAAEGEANIGEFSANVGLLSDYTFRGVSQTDEDPALQGGMDWSHDSGLYAGLWGSNVDFNDGDEAHLELDVYGGFSKSFGNFTVGLGAIYYMYPGARDGLDYDFLEITPSVGYDFGFASATLAFYYSPDYFGGSDDAQYYDLSVEVPLAHGFMIAGNVGYQAIDDNATFGLPDYLTWGVGIGFELGTLHSKLSNFSVGLNYVDTDIDDNDCTDICDGRAVLSLSAAF